VQQTPSILEWLPEQSHKFLLLFDPGYAEWQPDTRGSDHCIKLITSEDKLRMGPICQLSQEEERYWFNILRQCLERRRYDHPVVRSEVQFSLFQNPLGKDLGYRLNINI
jgi:hypothetical protein